MTGRTHDLAAITGLFLVVIINPVTSITLSTALLSLFANQIGGITPDIDQPTAPFWRSLPIGGFFGSITSKLLGGHRFLSHSIVGVALFSWMAKLFLEFVHPLIPTVNIGYVWWAYFIGILSHLIFDSFTKEGVPWLLPIPIKFGFPPTKKLRIVTGKKIENYLVFPSLICVNAFFFITHYQQILELIQKRII